MVRVRSSLKVNKLETLGLDDWWKEMRGDGSDGTVRSTGFDLAIALKFLSPVYGSALFDGLVVGELSLNGDVRRVRGLIPMLRAATVGGIERALVPTCQIHEARFVKGIELVPVSHIMDVIEKREPALPRKVLAPIQPSPYDLPPNLKEPFERAREAVRAGKHVLLVGPLGSGKTMIARRLAAQLEPIHEGIALVIAAIRSASGLPIIGDLAGVRRPFRAPHHTASAAAILGGTRPVRPGEVTLAHEGILFLDDLPEFPFRVLEGVRHAATNWYSGAGMHDPRLPSKIIVVAAMPRCPCDPLAGRACRCSPRAVVRWKARVQPFIEALKMERIELD
jgi:magnesium chelatase family protein